MFLPQTWELANVKWLGLQTLTLKLQDTWKRMPVLALQVKTEEL